MILEHRDVPEILELQEVYEAQAERKCGARVARGWRERRELIEVHFKLQFGLPHVIIPNHNFIIPSTGDFSCVLGR